MIHGHARVSTDGQSVAAQMAQLAAAGAEMVFADAASGAKTDRAQLRRGLAQLAADGEPVREIARSYDVSAATISRLIA